MQYASPCASMVLSLPSCLVLTFSIHGYINNNRLYSIKNAFSKLMVRAAAQWLGAPITQVMRNSIYHPFSNPRSRHGVNEAGLGLPRQPHDSLSCWFNRDEETEERFYPCQQCAIETVIYCHEVLRIGMLCQLYAPTIGKALA